MSKEITFEEYFEDKIQEDPSLESSGLITAFEEQWDYQQSIIDKLEQDKAKLIKSLKEIANGHLYEKVSEMIAKNILEEIGEGE